jgi:hypothetical protein
MRIIIDHDADTSLHGTGRCGDPGWRIYVDTSFDDLDSKTKEVLERLSELKIRGLPSGAIAPSGAFAGKILLPAGSDRARLGQLVGAVLSGEYEAAETALRALVKSSKLQGK